MKPHTTTKRHFAIFKAEVERCVRLFRIVGWRVECYHEGGDGTFRARVHSSAKDHAADVVLARDWGKDDPTNAKVREAARHEAIHLIVDELDEVAQFRYVTETQRVHALESVVRHLEAILPR